MKPLFICMLAATIAVACTDKQPGRTTDQSVGENAVRRESPVKWTISPLAMKLAAGETASARVDLALQSGWHIYATTQPVAGPTGGPMPTRIVVLPGQPFVPAGDPEPTSKPEVKFDEAFGITVQQHDSSVGFHVPVRLTTAPMPDDSLRINVRYQVCNAKLCYPPQTVKLATAVTSGGE